MFYVLVEKDKISTDSSTTVINFNENEKVKIMENSKINQSETGQGL